MNAAIRFLLYGFTYYLTLSSECFSTFPRGTCILSVYHTVFSFTRVTPRSLGYVPKQPDSKSASFTAQVQLRGFNPLLQPVSGHFASPAQLPLPIKGHNSSAQMDIGFSLSFPYFTRSYYRDPVWFLFLR